MLLWLFCFGCAKVLVKSAPALQNEISRTKEGIVQYKPWKQIYPSLPECSSELLSAVAVWLRYITDEVLRADHFCNVFVYILHEKPHMYTYWEFILYNCLITSMRTYVFLQLSPFLPLTSLFSLHFHPTISPSHPSLSIQELLHDKSISVCVNVTPVCSPHYTKLGSAGPIMTFPVQSITQRPI